MRLDFEDNYFGGSLFMNRKTDWYYEYVFIEEEEIIRNYWKKIAKEKNIKLLVLQSTSEFRLFVDNISKLDTKIYLDCDLGKGETRGDDFAILLHEDGYKQLHIATNYQSEDFSHLPWLKYHGKECPFKSIDKFTATSY